MSDTSEPTGSYRDRLWAQITDLDQEVGVTVRSESRATIRQLTEGWTEDERRGLLQRTDEDGWAALEQDAQEFALKNSDEVEVEIDP